MWACVCFASLLQLNSVFFWLAIPILASASAPASTFNFFSNERLKNERQNRRMKWLKKEMKRKILGAFECSVHTTHMWNVNLHASQQLNEMLLYLILGNLMSVLCARPFKHTFVSHKYVDVHCVCSSSCPCIFETVESHVRSCSWLASLWSCVWFEDHISIKQSQRCVCKMWKLVCMATNPL